MRYLQLIWACKSPLKLFGAFPYGSGYALQSFFTLPPFGLGGKVKKISASIPNAKQKPELTY
jgi:hypothetical protein